MRILNGRVTGDLDGKLTSYQSNGASTVDYGIVSEDLQNTVLGFQVQALTPYSDHCPITLKLASRNRDIINNVTTHQRILEERKRLLKTVLPSFFGSQTPKINL